MEVLMGCMYRGGAVKRKIMSQRSIFFIVHIPFAFLHYILNFPRAVRGLQGDCAYVLRCSFVWNYPHLPPAYYSGRVRPELPDTAVYDMPENTTMQTLFEMCRMYIYDIEQLLHDQLDLNVKPSGLPEAAIGRVAVHEQTQAQQLERLQDTIGNKTALLTKLELQLAERPTIEDVQKAFQPHIPGDRVLSETELIKRLREVVSRRRSRWEKIPVPTPLPWGAREVETKLSDLHTTKQQPILDSDCVAGASVHDEESPRLPCSSSRLDTALSPACSSSAAKARQPERGPVANIWPIPLGVAIQEDAELLTGWDIQESGFTHVPLSNETLDVHPLNTPAPSYDLVYLHRRATPPHEQYLVGPYSSAFKHQIIHLKRMHFDEQTGRQRSNQEVQMLQGQLQLVEQYCHGLRDTNAILLARAIEGDNLIHHLQDGLYRTTMGAFRTGPDGYKLRVVRIRPLLEREQDEPIAAMIIRPGQDRHPRIELTNDLGQKQFFRFNHALDTHCGNADVFELVLPLVTASLHGHTVLIAMDGPSHGGKSHTMLSRPDSIIPLALRWISRWRGEHCRIQMSVLEVYGTSIRDLLAIDLERTDPKLVSWMMDSVKGFKVDPLHSEPVQTEEDGVELVSGADGNLATAWFLDLAGSERPDAAMNETQKKEYDAIAMGRFYIHCAMRGDTAGLNNNILTRVLRECFSGERTKVALITCITNLQADAKLTRSILDETKIPDRKKNKTS
ncbi:hypothetical protein LTR15_005580 [Elasticomyces elasticus]|nr:hypothetical protein LTR15_005580 [Elasticomyces elasticus]